jgi:aryl-alcohol dehydrogenase-like predicted oxidoreductase
MKKYMTDANYDRIEKLEAWARARDRGLSELAGAWLLAQPQVCSVILVPLSSSMCRKT